MGGGGGLWAWQVRVYFVAATVSRHHKLGMLTKVTVDFLIIFKGVLVSAKTLSVVIFTDSNLSSTTHLFPAIQ